MNTKQLIVAAALLLLGVVVGYSLGKYSGHTQIASNQPGLKQTQTEKVQTNSLFNSQTATFQGTITKVSGSTLSVKSDSGQTGNLPVSSKVVIYNSKPGSPQASASSDLKLIDTNQKALIFLELIDGKYQVTHVSYLPPPPKK